MTTHWMAVVGVTFMVFVLFFPRGIWGSILHWVDRPAAGAEKPRGTAQFSKSKKVTQRFGKFVALNNLSASFQPGKLTAIIGTNRAGKRTFFNVVSGAFAPTQGRIRFQGQDITGSAQHEFARLGIAKSFQITNVFKQLSAHENVRVAAQKRSTRFQLDKPRSDMKALIERADALLDRVGLAALCGKTAGDLAHGQQRALEIAIALASEPALLLMDEPTAGMSPEETTLMMKLITELAAERKVVLVEHKMKLVMGLCERLIVLYHGEFLAEGTPEQIRANSDVRRAYLGEG